MVITLKINQLLIITTFSILKLILGMMIAKLELHWISIRVLQASLKLKWIKTLVDLTSYQMSIATTSEDS